MPASFGNDVKSTLALRLYDAQPSAVAPKDDRTNRHLSNQRSMSLRRSTHRLAASVFTDLLSS